MGDTAEVTVVQVDTASWATEMREKKVFSGQPVPVVVKEGPPTLAVGDIQTVAGVPMVAIRGI